jgi:hypothetical protein
MTKVVLGSGPIGLIAAKILKANLIIGDRIGGNILLRNITPTYLWRTEATKRFLNELGMQWKEKDIRFGWITPEEKYVDVASTEDRICYYHRSRNTYHKESIPTSVASSGKAGIIESFDVSVGDIVTRLTMNYNGLRTKIQSIKMLAPQMFLINTDEGNVSTNQIINTLPAHIWDRVFYSLSFMCKKRGYALGPKCWVLGKAFTKKLQDQRDHSFRKFLYCADPEIPFDRVTFLNDHQCYQFSYEFNKYLPPDDFVEEVDGEVILSGDYQILGNGKESKEFNGDVYHVGRFARWDHSIRIHDVIEELYNDR